MADFRKYKGGNFEMKTPLLITILFLTLTIFIQAEIFYVSPTGTSTPTPPYLTWETAADSIQKAIDICDNGDTVIVANGTYYESIYVNKTIHLLGTNVDSTIIYGSGTPAKVTEFFENNSVLENFSIVGPGKEVLAVYGIYLLKSNIKVNNCKIRNIFEAIRPFNSSPIIENIFISDVIKAIWEECPNDTCKGIYRNNVIISTGGSETPVHFGFGGYPTFINNILIEQGDIWTGLDGSSLRGIVVKNNLISGYKTEGIQINYIRTDTAYIINNTVVYNSFETQFAYASITTGTAGRTQIKNNIVANTPRGIEGYQTWDSTRVDYNLFWNVEKITLGNAVLRDSNIIADPMFVHDTIPTPLLTYDYHLQKYSPAIDKGDPAILDKDQTRSDLGMFGGPGGEEYTYMDLSPRAPVNFTAAVTSDSIKLKWNRNSESDTSYYSVYIDSTANFTLDSTNIISKQADTLFTYLNPQLNKHYYFKVTAIDKQGNQSHPSEEIHVVITSADEKDYPVEISDYKLYQNYPNPFNPTTKIGYRLKQRGFVRLAIYDIKGELVKTLINKDQEKGYYEIDFNGKDLASQILLYRIEVTGKGNIPVYSDMKKMIILR